MKDEASYTCDSCGEEIVVPIDLSAGTSQEYVEDCPVCCRPNVIHVEVDEEGTCGHEGKARPQGNRHSNHENNGRTPRGVETACGHAQRHRQAVCDPDQELHPLRETSHWDTHDRSDTGPRILRKKVK